MKKNKSRPLSYSIHKNNSKWIKYLNVRTETIKLFEENTSMIQIVQATKAKINKQNYNKLKSFYTAKEIIIKMKRQPMNQEKILANHLSDRGLVYRMYEEHLQLNTKKI